MNAPTKQPEANALALPTTSYEVGQVTDAAAMILGPSFERVRSFAELMSKGAVSVPKHFRGNMGDCMAITIQALGWKMNPFAVAQKTHLSQSGALGYEAQLVSAVLVSTGAIQEEPEYEAVGDWNKVLGKVAERVGQKRDDGSGGGKYYVATYTEKDEEGLGVIVRAKMGSSGNVRELKVMMSQAYPRFSTQWATDPFQQLCYLAIRKWGRLNTPGALLGVYTQEELDSSEPRDMGMVDEVKPPAPTEWPADLFAERLPVWRKAIADKRAKVDDVIAKAKTKYPLSAEQEAEIRKPDATDVTAKSVDADGVVTMTYAQVADKLNGAKTADDLDTAASLITAVADKGQQGELSAIYETRKTAFTA